MVRSGQQTTKGGAVSRTSILSHVARYDRSNLEDASTLVLSYRSIGPEVTSLKQLGPKKRLMEVETIFLDHNSLRKFEPEQTVRTVRELYLDHNYLKDIDGANPMLSQLETLSLTSNRLTSLKNMTGFKRLRVLRVGNNRLTSLHGLTGGATSNTLDTLVLSHNHIAHQYQLSELANFPMLSVLDLRENPIGSSPEIMKFALLCCPNLRIFNGQKVTDADVISASEWGSGSARGRSVNCLIEVIREMETLSRQARERSSTGLLRSDFIAYLSTFDDASACGSAVAADQYVRTSPDILTFQDPQFLCEQDRDIIRKEQMLAQWDAKVARDRASGLYDDQPLQLEHPEYDEAMDDYYEQPPARVPPPSRKPGGSSDSGAPAAGQGAAAAGGSSARSGQAPAARTGQAPAARSGQAPAAVDHQDDYPEHQADNTADYQGADSSHQPASNPHEEQPYQGQDEQHHDDPADENFEHPTEERHAGEDDHSGQAVHDREFAPQEMARQSVFAQPPSGGGEEESVDGPMSWKSPDEEEKDVHESHMEQYGAKIRKQRADAKKQGGSIGILPRRERILNVRYMTNTIKETSKSQNTLLESKVRSLFIQHLKEQDGNNQ